jgi:predicted O-methyltransferase YrrM
MVVKDLDGWLSEKEGELLYNLAKQCKEGYIVEIGSYKGKSTIYLAQGSLAGHQAPVVAIDPHLDCTGYEFLSNLDKAGVNKHVKSLHNYSWQVYWWFWHRPIELLFIDGSHKYKDVLFDLELYFPLVLDGGVIAFHDSVMFDGVRKVVNEIIFESPHFKDVDLVHSITYATKTYNSLSFKDLWKKCLARLKKLYYDTTRDIKLPIRSMF